MRITVLAAITVSTFGSAAGRAQSGPEPLARLIAAARSANPEVAAGRASVARAEALARQAGAFPNPNLLGGREHATGTPGTNAQSSIQIEQRLALTGVRQAERSAAGLRVEAARTEAERIAGLLDARVVRAYCRLVAGRRRSRLAERLQALADSAVGIVTKRFQAGDASGYERRRLELESARFAAAALAARFEADSAAVELAALTRSQEPPGGDTLPAPRPLPPLDSLLALTAGRGDVAAARLAVAAAEADRTARTRERIPVPSISAGYLSQTTPGTPGFSGWLAAVSLPVPVFDRRAGQVAAGAAQVERSRADAARLERDAQTEVRQLDAGLRTAAAQHALLAGRLGAEADLALRAVAVAFAEGELPLAQWLDAVRAYYEARTALHHLETELAVRTVDLATAAGIPWNALMGGAR